MDHNGCFRVSVSPFPSNLLAHPHPCSNIYGKWSYGGKTRFNYDMPSKEDADAASKGDIEALAKASRTPKQ
jgi:hypothetical protein